MRNPPGPQLLTFLALCIALLQPMELGADPVPVRHIEGVMLGFLVMRNLDGQPIAYGELKQVVEADGLVSTLSARLTS